MARVDVASIISVSGGASVSGQANLSFRVNGVRSGKLFIEMPVARVANVSVGIDPRSVDASKSEVFFTPGVRYTLLRYGRVSPYIAGGGGFAWFSRGSLTVDGPIEAHLVEGLVPAIDFGGGVDFRVTRIIGIRAEVRDFVALGDHITYRNNPVFAAGVLFRFGGNSHHAN